MEPATIWQPNSGEGEYTSTGNPSIDTEAGFDIITEAGLNLIQEDSSLTQVPATIYTQADGT